MPVAVPRRKREFFRMWRAFWLVPPVRAGADDLYWVIRFKPVLLGTCPASLRPL
jgi:hypothetical protein